MTVRLSAFRFTALFILSVTGIAYELAVMRSFAVGSWSNFGAMVISIALLGFGLAGTALTFFRERIAANPDRWLLWPALLLAPAMTLAHVLAQQVPFNPVMITIDATQFLWIAAYYALYVIPFIIAAVFIGVAFIAFRGNIHQLYFWNMLGSGLGGFLILGLMYVLPPNRLMGPLVAITALSSFLCLVEPGGRPNAFRLPLWKAATAGIVLAVSMGVLLAAGDIRVSEYKSISYARQFPDARLVHHAFGPMGEFDAFQSSYFHFAPGLSDNASSNLASMPVDAYLGLYIDGDGPIGVMRKLKPEEEAYFDYLPMAAPYQLKREPSVLLLRLGGGIGANGALHHGARRVTVVEPDPELVRMLHDEAFFKNYTGGLLSDPRIRLVTSEPRAFTGSTRERFDLVEISLIDSIGLSSTGGYPIVENFLYTADGIASYLSCLGENGILSITVWNRLTPPRNVPKLLATVAEALKTRGYGDPASHVFGFNLLLSTATILVKNSPFTPDEVAELKGFTERMSYTNFWYPGMPAPKRDFKDILADYRSTLEPAPASGGETKAAAPSAAPAAGSGEFLPWQLYHITLAWLFQGRERELDAGYPFNIRPVSDDRPYYTAYVKPETLPYLLANMKDFSEEWGYILLIATFVVSLVFGALIILVPMIGRRKELFHRRPGTKRVIVYFACLGIGYMLVEIFLIQRLTYFLVDPIFSTSVIITSMLVLSGVGSLVSGGLKLPPRRAVGLAVIGISASMLFYIFGLSPALNALLGLALPAKILLTILFVSPAAFCLGIPFPTGLSMLSEHRPGLVPWAWGVNGALSVTGSVLARLASVQFGFAFVLALTMGLYITAWLTFSGNEAAEPVEMGEP